MKDIISVSYENKNIGCCSLIDSGSKKRKIPMFNSVCAENQDITLSNIYEET